MISWKGALWSALVGLVVWFLTWGPRLDWAWNRYVGTPQTSEPARCEVYGAINTRVVVRAYGRARDKPGSQIIKIGYAEVFYEWTLTLGGNQTPSRLAIVAAPALQDDRIAEPHGGDAPMRPKWVSRFPEPKRPPDLYDRVINIENMPDANPLGTVTIRRPLTMPTSREYLALRVESIGAPGCTLSVPANVEPDVENISLQYWMLYHFLQRNTEPGETLRLWDPGPLGLDDNEAVTTLYCQTPECQGFVADRLEARTGMPPGDRVRERNYEKCRRQAEAFYAVFGAVDGPVCMVSERGWPHCESGVSLPGGLPPAGIAKFVQAGGCEVEAPEGGN